MVRIAHREYLGDVTGSTAFSLQSFGINPGVNSTFPWLANIATNYQMYRFRGLIFEFKSMSANALNSVNTALGTVIMGTQYDVGAPNFANKAEMENYEFSESDRPCEHQMHPVECALRERATNMLYVRSGAYRALSDPRLYDTGTFQIATVGMQAAANIGELWVTYDVELYKPRIDPGLTAGLVTKISNGAYVAATDVLGSIQTVPSGNLGVTVASNAGGWNRIVIPSTYTSGRILIALHWKGAVAAAVAMPTTVLANCTLVTQWALNTETVDLAPQGGTNNSARLANAFVIQISGYNVNGSYIDFTPGTGTLPATPTSFDMFAVSVPSSY